ncbi:MAG: hypothetical protein NTW25_15245 [Candidatus Kapabacteria bacterium]|nr:hypothetical protein [Candidatus Kapabacteria bacterium]
MNKEYQKTNKDDGLDGVALIFGFYIVEVIERNHGTGKMEQNHEIGENTFPFYWNGSDLFPYGWCGKRIFDGEGDNVAVKYKLLILDSNNK